ncbi:MAG: complex I subunit 1/NuoH family protein [Candidatus Micrarchaeaceae archaeon]
MTLQADIGNIANIPYWIGGDPLHQVIGIIIYIIIISITFSIFGYMVGWLERKLIARAQYRHGPTYVGMWGLLQNLADLIKLLSKEDVIPENAYRPLFAVSLPLLLALSIFIVLLLPYSPTLQATNLGFGLLIIVTIISFLPLLLFTAGFSSGNKFAGISAQRSILVLLSYELPVLIVIATVAMLAGGYSLNGIISSQATHYYFGLLMPIGFVVFFIALLAEFERPPFDLREADSELIAGWLTDVSAPYYALALFLDYARMFLGSILVSILFLGGWLGPSFLPPLFWILLKAFIVSIFVIVVRATAFRMRVDRVLRFGWFWLIPLSLINLIITYMVFVK